MSADGDVLIVSDVPMQDFEQFYRAEASGAVKLATLLSSPQDAHDLVQDAFVGLLRNWERTDAPRAYLRRSIYNGAISGYRRRSSQEAKVLALTAQERSVRPEFDYVDDQLAKLNSRQRAVVVLRFFLQLNDREIAELTGMKVGSVGPTLSRALKQLRKGLEDDY